jgi:hypothetical protein
MPSPPFFCTKTIPINTLYLLNFQVFTILGKQQRPHQVISMAHIPDLILRGLKRIKKSTTADGQVSKTHPVVLPVLVARGQFGGGPYLNELSKKGCVHVTHKKF